MLWNDEIITFLQKKLHVSNVIFKGFNSNSYIQTVKMTV